MGMSSSLDMSDLLVILGMFDDMESSSYCCTSISLPEFHQAIALRSSLLRLKSSIVSAIVSMI